jgi:tetratricopeptide (TPR) repeat protein
LGLAYLNFCSRAWDPTVLEKAIKNLQEALGMTEENTSEYATLLFELANAYEHSYFFAKLTGSRDLAISCYKRALEIEKANQNGTAVARCEVRLAQLDLLRYTDTQDPLDWETAMRLLEDALDHLPDTEIVRGSAFFLLGRGHSYTPLVSSAQAADEEIHLRKAALCFQSALGFTASLPMERISAGVELLEVYASLKDWSQAFRTATVILSLVPLILDRSLENSDMQWYAQHLAGVATKAAAVALLAGESPYAGLRFLEAGSGKSTLMRFLYSHPRTQRELEKWAGM